MVTKRVEQILIEIYFRSRMGYKMTLGEKDGKVVVIQTKAREDGVEIHDSRLPMSPQRFNKLYCDFVIAINKDI